MADFSGRTALITGAGSGIGRAMAHAFAAHGAAVAIVDHDPKGGQAAADEVAAHGGKAHAWAADVGDANAAQDIFADVESQLGPVDILINNAGVRDIASCLDLSVAEWDKVLRVNLTGAFIYAQAAARRMVHHSRGGAIISITSVGGLTGLALRSAYVASKHGLVGLTKVLALELAAHNIRVNAIAPGGVDTPMATEAFKLSPDTSAAIKRAAPLGRLARAEEVADLAVYLASDRAAFITGSVVSIDGGFMAGLGK